MKFFFISVCILLLLTFPQNLPYIPLIAYHLIPKEKFYLLGQKIKSPGKCSNRIFYVIANPEFNLKNQKTLGHDENRSDGLGGGAIFRGLQSHFLKLWFCLDKVIQASKVRCQTPLLFEIQGFIRMKKKEFFYYLFDFYFRGILIL